MNDALLLLAWLTPLLLACLMPILASRWWLATAPIPALLTSLLVPNNTQSDAPWLLMGMNFSLDELNQPFALFSSLIWLLALMYLALKQPRYIATVIQRVFLLLALAGNMLLLYADDMTTFFIGYAMMGLSAYPLILQGQSQQARIAGKVYLAWTMLGEVLIFSALLIITGQAGSTQFDVIHSVPFSDTAFLLVLIGFGIKLAMPLLHHWLPLSYYAAPAVMVAILSAPMMNAGLLGWLRFLPIGQPDMQSWGQVMIGTGCAAIFFGSALGILQHRSRMILAYSSMAKMGILTLFIGIALLLPDASELLMAAIIIFAIHHLLVKGLLFLGIAEWENNGAQYSLLALFGGLAISLAAFPLTLGATAKTLLLEATPASISSEVSLIMLLASILTTLIMLRFITSLSTRKGMPIIFCSPMALVYNAIMLVTITAPFWLSNLALATSGLSGIIAGSIFFAILYRFIKRPLLPSPYATVISAWRLLSRLKSKRIVSKPTLSVPEKWLNFPLSLSSNTNAMALSGALWISVMLFILLLFALN